VFTTVVPACFIFLIAFAIAWLMMMIYEAIIDTIFLCFLVDSEKNKDGIMMASKSLQALVGKYEGNSAVFAVQAKDTPTVKPAPNADESAAAAPVVASVPAAAEGGAAAAAGAVSETAPLKG
jgi:hypothetical protein